jgi:hypothetical protein
VRGIRRRPLLEGSSKALLSFSDILSVSVFPFSYRILGHVDSGKNVALSYCNGLSRLFAHILHNRDLETQERHPWSKRCRHFYRQLLSTKVKSRGNEG